MEHIAGVSNPVADFLSGIDDDDPVKLPPIFGRQNSPLYPVAAGHAGVLQILPVEIGRDGSIIMYMHLLFYYICFRFRYIDIDDAYFKRIILCDIKAFVRLG